MSKRVSRRARTAAVSALAIALLGFVRLGGHEIPMDVTVQALLKPEGQALHLVVRVPMRAMRDVEFPLRESGALDLARADHALRTAALQWIANGIALYEEDVRLPPPALRAVRVSLPSDRSFASFGEAAAHLTGPPLAADLELPWDQGLLDVWLTYPIASATSGVSIRPGFERLGIRVVTVLRFLAPSGAVRAFELGGDPGVVRLDPRWHQAALRFVELGFFHILDGIDHLLFLLCLVIPFRRLRPLVLIVTSFTVAHSMTLAASALGLSPGGLWFPPLVEALIAASIVYMAIENVVSPGHLHRRWVVAFGFGLVHGFGFSFALRETLQFAGSHLLTSLVSFNVGVELGQLLVLAILVPVLNALFRVVKNERMGAIVLSVFVAHTGWHWLTERLEVLSAYQPPALDPAAVVRIGGRMALAAVLVSGIVWWMTAARRYRGAATPVGRAARPD